MSIPEHSSGPLPPPCFGLGSSTPKMEQSKSKALTNLQAALERAFAGRPKVGGFPYLTKTLRQAGVTRNIWHLPSCQSLYLTADGAVVSQMQPLLSGTADVPPFDREALIKTLRIDQAGNGTFPVHNDRSFLLRGSSSSTAGLRLFGLGPLGKIPKRGSLLATRRATASIVDSKSS
jgi:uncharacterized protein YbcV (DUF1398 family)